MVSRSSSEINIIEKTKENTKNNSKNAPFLANELVTTTTIPLIKTDFKVDKIRFFNLRLTITN